MTKSKDLLIVGHLGLGDLIIIHGVIRKLIDIKEPRRIFVLVKSCFLRNASEMFSDISNLYFITTSAEYLSEARPVKPPIDFNGEVIDCWWYGYDPKVFTEHAIYLSLGLDINDRYKYFKIPRRPEVEQTVYNQVVGDSKNYIFIHDDPQRRYNISLNAINTDYDKVIYSRNLNSYSICDLLMVLERAKECHVIYSSFAMLIDALGFSKLFIHESYINKIPNTINAVILEHLSNRKITLV